MSQSWGKAKKATEARKWDRFWFLLGVDERVVLGVFQGPFNGRRNRITKNVWRGDEDGKLEPFDLSRLPLVRS